MSADVDLSDLVPDLKVQVNPSDGDLYAFTTSQWVSLLRGSFWEAYLVLS